MSDPIMSPDGKFMWTGSEWIPAPPVPAPASASANIVDSVVMGNVSINDTSAISNAVQNASQCRNCSSNNVSIIICSECKEQAFCSVCRDEIVAKRLELGGEMSSIDLDKFSSLCNARTCNSCFNFKADRDWLLYGNLYIRKYG